MILKKKVWWLIFNIQLFTQHIFYQIDINTLIVELWCVILCGLIMHIFEIILSIKFYYEKLAEFALSWGSFCIKFHIVWPPKPQPNSPNPKLHQKGSNTTLKPSHALLNPQTPKMWDVSLWRAYIPFFQYITLNNDWRTWKFPHEGWTYHWVRSNWLNTCQ